MNTSHVVKDSDGKTHLKVLTNMQSDEVRALYREYVMPATFNYYSEPLVLRRGEGLYVEDADAVFQQALDAGATVGMPLEDAFWGDRYGKVVDPFGHIWGIATHKQDLSEEEMMRRAQEFAGQSA